MDVQMPVVGGYEATRKIREMERGTNRRTVIIALTASALDTDRTKCIAEGMDDYISKPFRPQELMAAVRRGRSMALTSRETREAA